MGEFELAIRAIRNFNCIFVSFRIELNNFAAIAKLHHYFPTFCVKEPRSHLAFYLDHFSLVTHTVFYISQSLCKICVSIF